MTRCMGLVVAVHGHGAEGVEGVEPGDDMAEDGVLAVVLGHGLEADEELAAIAQAGGIELIGEPAHGDGAEDVLPVDLGLERVAPGRQCRL